MDYRYYFVDSKKTTFFHVDAEYFGRKNDLLCIIYRKCAVVSHFGDPLN